MARPEGSIKLKVTFKAFSKIEIPDRSILESAFKKAASKLGIWVGDFSYEAEKLIFTIEYKINVNITGAITSLKATSSRAMNKNFNEKSFKKAISRHSNEPRRSEIPGLMNLEVFKAPISDMGKSEFWEHGYNYQSII